MAAMTTALTDFDSSRNFQSYTYTGNTSAAPKFVLQRRRVPSGNQTILEDTIQVTASTEDSAGAILPSKVSFHVTVRRPIQGIPADVTAALAVFRDIIAGDEFANTVDTQEWLV